MEADPEPIRADAEVGPDGAAQVFLRPLEGCYSRAPTYEEALSKAPAKVRSFLAWLEGHGEALPWASGELPIQECEVVQGEWPVNLGDSVALFACDRGPLSREEIERNLRWMAYSWADFLDAWGAYPEVGRDRKPEGQLRTPRKIVRHVALVMVWYASKLRSRGDPAFRWPPGMSMWSDARAVEKGDLSRERLESLREACAYRLVHLRPPEREGRITYHAPGGWTGRTEPEGWTARKVFRRFLWHERLHLHTLEKIRRAYEREG